VWAGMLVCISVFAQEVSVPATQIWTDTGIDLKPGDTIVITAAGR